MTTDGQRVYAEVVEGAFGAMDCNFARVHKTLKQTPAMEAGLATRAWTLQEMDSGRFKLTHY